MRSQFGERAYGKENAIKKICWEEQPLKCISNREMLALVSGENMKDDATSGCKLEEYYQAPLLPGG